MTKHKVGIIGSGVVAKTLGQGFLRHGHAVMVGSRSPATLEALRAELGAELATGTFAQATTFGDVLVFAIKGTAALATVAMIGADLLAGKVVIDTTNPIADLPPVDGVLQFFTGPNDSLLERLARAAPKAHWVKAWNSVGHLHMVDPSFPGGRPSMFICGNDLAARRQVAELLDQFGWDSEDLGEVTAARAIEPLCQLWCIPGLREQRWNHAFKLLKR